MVLLEHEKLQQGLSSLIGQAQEMADDLSGVKDFSLAAEAQEMAVRCFGGEVDVATTPLTGIVAASGAAPLTGIVAASGAPLTGIVAARGQTSAGQRKRKRGHRPGHVGCTLAQELEEDRKNKAESFKDRIATLARVCILMLQPALSALELIGRSRGECWDFWEVPGLLLHERRRRYDGNAGVM